LGSIFIILTVTVLATHVNNKRRPTRGSVQDCEYAPNNDPASQVG
jgi:hypothetical protein